MRANREAFERWKIVPRMLRDVSRRDIGVELFGRRIPAPVLFGPVGAAELLHPEADVAIARAAAELGVPYIFTSQACAPMEECAAVMGEAPRWFQLYWSTDEGLVDSFLARARAAGAEAVVVTLDTTMLGWRTMDLNLGYLPFARGRGIAQYTADGRFRQIVRERLAAADGGTGGDVKVSLGAIKTLISISRSFPGSFLENLRSPEPRAAVATFLDIYSRPSLTWRDIETLRDRTDLPILLKGIQHPDDARRAVEAGVDGIVVSNHGGRQVDGAIGSLDALADIAPVVDGKARLLLDSGVRGGSDVFKAIALGADAVLIARPYLYGLALAGWAATRRDHRPRPCQHFRRRRPPIVNRIKGVNARNTRGPRHRRDLCTPLIGKPLVQQVELRLIGLELRPRSLEVLERDVLLFGVKKPRSLIFGSRSFGHRTSGGDFGVERRQRRRI